METVNFSWIMLLGAIVVGGYLIAAKNSKLLPAIPLFFLVGYFLFGVISQFFYQFPWAGEWPRYFRIASEVFLAWCMARVVFWLVFEIPPLLRDGKGSLPKITRDFVLFISFAILLLIVLRFRSNVNLASLLTTSAVLTVVIGLAAQTTLSNFFSGLIIQAENPFNIGDWIRFDDNEGRVVGISWKSTQVLTREQVLVYIPNAVLASSTFRNFSKPTRKKIARIFIGVEYGAPPNKVAAVLTDVLRQHPKILKRPRPNIRLIEFGDFAITYEIRYWHQNYAAEPQINADINRQLWYALRRNEIRIPFPIRDVFHGHIERKYAKEQDEALRSEIEQMLAGVPILAPLSETEISDLASRVGIEVYGKEELIVEEGEAGDSMYIIRSGACEALKVENNKQLKLLSTMHRGDFFGEISLLTGYERTATIRAIDDTSLVVIDKDIFSTVMVSNPHISEQIGQVMFDRQKEQGILIEDSANDLDGSQKFINRIKQFFGI